MVNEKKITLYFHSAKEGKKIDMIKNNSNACFEIVKKYNHPILFYGLAIFVPWICWFILAWLSHSKLWENSAVVFWGSILGVIGLCGPFGIAMILMSLTGGKSLAFRRRL